jgi:hypothetical protein
MRDGVAIVFIAGIVAMPMVSQAWDVSSPIMLAQAGSTGGTIGKQNKSVSGSDEGAAPRREVAKPPGQASSPCAKLPGTWSWFVNGDVTIRANGTHVQGNLTGTWTCSNGQVVLVWSHGFTDRLTLSPDGNNLDGSNGMIRVTGTRK